MRKVFSVVLLFLAAAVAVSLQSCRGVDSNIIPETADALELRDYQRAMQCLLRASDEELLDSDTLMMMLSMSYYGLAMPPERGVGLDCVDMDFMNDGRTVVFTDMGDGSLNFYSYPELKFDSAMSLPAPAFNMDVSRDGSKIAVALGDGSILIQDLASGDRHQILRAHSGPVRDVVFNGNDTLYSSGNDHTVAAWSIASGELLWSKKPHIMNVKRLRGNGNGTMLLTASNDGTACILDTIGDGKTMIRLVHGKNYVNDGVFSPDSKKVVTIGGDGYLKVWDAENGKMLHRLFLGDPLSSVDVSDNGSMLLVGGQYGAYLIDTADWKIVSKIDVDNMPLWGVRFVANDEIAFVDKTNFRHGRVLTGQNLIADARKRFGHVSK